jgi:hypothetical protein
MPTRRATKALRVRGRHDQRVTVGTLFEGFGVNRIAFGRAVDARHSRSKFFIRPYADFARKIFHRQKSA